MFTVDVNMTQICDGGLLKPTRSSQEFSEKKISEKYFFRRKHFFYYEIFRLEKQM